ncbi:hypothetical protein NPIL_375131 [Nephila pilipes]|uniref:Uncharacterized protein n=1 Tax=Nephila pilipes TaxID=299642 RepID=A0A8X6NXK1_NEPPI|nr:hypothetical protein NPIL_375131 [Nephila pilipes]
MLGDIFKSVRCSGEKGTIALGSARESDNLLQIKIELILAALESIQAVILYIPMHSTTIQFISVNGNSSTISCNNGAELYDAKMQSPLPLSSSISSSFELVKSSSVVLPPISSVDYQMNADIHLTNMLP